MSYFWKSFVFGDVRLSETRPITTTHESCHVLKTEPDEVRVLCSFSYGPAFERQRQRSDRLQAATVSSVFRAEQKKEDTQCNNAILARILPVPGGHGLRVRRGRDQARWGRPRSHHGQLQVRRRRQRVHPRRILWVYVTYVYLVHGQSGDLRHVPPERTSIWPATKCQNRHFALEMSGWVASRVPTLHLARGLRRGTHPDSYLFSSERCFSHQMLGQWPGSHCFCPSCKSISGCCVVCVQYVHCRRTYVGLPLHVISVSRFFPRFAKLWSLVGRVRLPVVFFSSC